MKNIIPIATIDDSDRLRPVDPAQVELLAASIKQTRLEQPIVIRPAGEGYRLTIGAHRLAALRLLGWTELVVGNHVVVWDDDEIDAKISEVDENLARHELNALDRALFLAERRRLYEEKNRVHSAGGDRKSKKIKEEIISATCGFDFSPRFTEDAAKRTGFSEDTIRRALHIAGSLDREAIKLLRGTRFERNQQELLALADLEASQQRDVAKALATTEAKSVREARVVIGLDKTVANDPQARCFAALLANWEKADAKTRKAFLSKIGATLGKAKGGAKAPKAQG